MKKIGRLIVGLLLLNVGALQAADYQVWTAADLTAALGRASEGDRVLVYAGDYSGNWMVPAGVSLLGAPEFRPLGALHVAPILSSVAPAPILTVKTSAGVSSPTQVRGLFLKLANHSAVVVVGNGTGFICGNGFERNQAERGGAIYTAASGALYIQTNYINNNTAVTDGGGICLDGSAGVALKDNNFNGNQAGVDGGGLFVGGNNLVISDQDLFQFNHAAQDGGAVAIVSCTRGGVFNAVQICNNGAGRDGGSMLVDHSSLMINNGGSGASTAGRNGGSIAVRSGAVRLAGYNCGSSTAGGYGGGVYSDSSTFAMAGSSISSCTAKNGAGIWINQMSPAGIPPLVLQSTFKKNRAIFDGGGLYLAAVPECRVENNIFFLNDAAINGGGMLVEADAMATVKNNTFAHLIPVKGLSPPTGEAIYIRGIKNATKVFNNIFAGYARGVVGEANLAAVVAGNDFYMTWLGALVGVPNVGMALNRQIGDPMFIGFDPRRAIGDFHLRMNSICRNVAISQFATAVDRDGNPRGAQPDRGAYEFIAP